MRKQILIPCVIVLAVCLWLLLHRTAPTKGGLVGVQATPTNQQAVSHAIETKNVTAPATLQSDKVSNPAKAPHRPTLTEITNLQQQMLADWQRPIEFYGKVVDENTNPVEGAQINFQWVETPYGEEGTRHTNTVSDADGLFALHGARGPSLDIWVSKDGYYSSHHGQWGFSYSHSNEKNVPDSSNPVIFQLHKKRKGEPLVGSDFPGFAHIAQLHHDGTPVELDLYKGAEVPAGSGQLKLEFWRAITNRNANVFDWKLQFSVPGGGLVETPEEFAFQAPEGGYQSPIVIDMPATNENWRGEIRSKYYLQLPDGKYGRIDFYFLPYNGAFTVQSAINPTGSRNLEPPP